MSEAGLSVRDMQLISTATGEPFTVEFLLDNPGYERFTLFYKASLERLGMGVSIRVVEQAASGAGGRHQLVRLRRSWAVPSQ